jgi:ABC-2 type transport system permease protein
MLRRNLRHALRYPSLTFGVALTPVIMLVMFAYLFGSALSLGVAGGTGGADYIDFVVPGVLLMTLGAGSQTTAMSICGDMAEGIVARFRTMPIARTSVLTGQVVASVVLTMVSVVLVVAVGLVMGFRPTAGPVEWLAATGLMVLMTIAITWLAVGLGLLAKAPEGAGNAVMPLSFFLPFLSTAFVPLESLPGAIRWFAEYQPYSPTIETLRGLLVGGPIGHHGWQAVAWAVVLGVAGYLWSRWLFNRDPVA